MGRGAIWRSRVVLVDAKTRVFGRGTPVEPRRPLGAAVVAEDRDTAGRIIRAGTVDTADGEPAAPDSRPEGNPVGTIASHLRGVGGIRDVEHPDTTVVPGGVETIGRDVEVVRGPKTNVDVRRRDVPDLFDVVEVAGVEHADAAVLLGEGVFPSSVRRPGNFSSPM